MGLDDKLISLAIDNGLLATEVTLQYETILNYVINNYPPHAQKVYEEIAYIRTRNWARSLSQERQYEKLSNPKEYKQGV